MSINLEQIKSKVSETKNQIEQSNDLSPEDKMAKAREFENVMSEINKDLESLKASATPQELKEIEKVEIEYKKLQEQLNVFKQELDDFQSSVVESVAANNNDSEIISSENDKPNRWERNKKTVLIWAGTLWVGLLIRKIWKDRKERKAAEANWTTSEKKPWYKKWRWMWLMWVAWFFGIKWLIDYLTNKTDKTDDAIDQVSDYEKLTEDQRLKYEKIWNCTNDFYSNIWGKEIDMWYKDDNYLWKISEDVKLKEWETPEKLAWVVPFCIDKNSKDISKFLSERDLNIYLFSKNYKELKNKIKGWTTDQLESFLWPFAIKLQSFQVFGMRPWKSLWENIQDWLNDDEEGRQKELDFFFRQYTKVLTYTNDRKTALEYKIAEESIKARWYDGDSRPEDREDQLDMIKDALSDKERFDTEIKNNETYVSFLSSNLLWVWSILESNWLLNWDISGQLSKEVIWPLDEESDDILKYDEDSKTTIIDKWISEIDWWLTDWTKDDLIDTCDDLRDDMVDESWTGFLQEHLERISYAWNMSDSNKDMFLKETGLDKFADKYTKTMDDFKEKIKNGTATKEDLEKLKKMSSEYLAFKKELNLAIYTLTQIIDDNPDKISRTINTVYKMFAGLAESFSNIFWWNGTYGDWINMWVTISVIWWAIYIIKHPGKVLLWTVSRTRQWITWVAWRPSLSYRWLKTKIGSLDNLADKTSYFKHYLFNWKIRSEKRILQLARNNFNIDVRSGTELLKRLDVPDQYVDQVWKYRWDKNLRNLFLSQDISGNVSWSKKLFHKKLSKVYSFNESALKKIKSIDVVSDANPKYSKSINRLLKNMKSLDDLDKLDLLVSDPKFLSKIEKLNIFQLKKVSRSIGKAWFTVDWIDSIIRWSTNIDVATKTKFNSIIDEAIASVKSQSSLNANFYKINESKLSSLKNNKNLTELDMKSLVKLNWKWFRWSSLPDLFDVLKSDISHNKWTGKLGDYLQDALKNWDYDSFVKVLWDHKNLITKIDVDDIIRQMDNVKIVLRNVDEFADILKWIWRIIKLI